MNKKILNYILESIGENAEEKLRNFEGIYSEKVEFDGSMVFFLTSISIFMIWCSWIYTNLIIIIGIELAAVFGSAVFGFVSLKKRKFWMCYLYYQMAGFSFTISMYLFTYFILTYHFGFYIRLAVLYLVFWMAVCMISTRNIFNNIKKNKYRSNYMKEEPNSNTKALVLIVIVAGIISRRIPYMGKMTIVVIPCLIMPLFVAAFIVSNIFRAFLIREYEPDKIWF